MDDLNCCLSKIVHLCIESCMFLNQLYKFEYQLSKLYSSYHKPSIKYFSILNHFTIIHKDLNIYYENYFLKIYSNIFTYLSRKKFALNYSNDITDDFQKDLNRLNYFLNYHKKYYKDIFYYLHKLSITCSLCIQYRRSCTNLELINRFVYIRIDLLTNLKKLNEKIKFLLIQINLNFQQKKQYSINNNNNNNNNNHYSKEKFKIFNLVRTIFLWFIIIFFIGYYFQWSIIYENKPKKGWPM
ncbi:unnamed protein product [Rotaria sp. Silwood2]|nr:unnamed protein product [Rotaria sp. Silwood2]CAF2845253.1 unnamed protein product [Rotaria sp. Silwood2]CAF3016979.1 unnamed protein product [Rotaria sp. Silwood2]CAF4329988.1 unnamed protein product [Rotaria sp. Silwood2]CAF4586203.1 unnamed protein product [Rotaria sp. Silwood2]